MKKRIATIIITVMLLNIFFVNVFASNNSETNTELLLNQLERYYGIDISIDVGYLSQNKALSMIDKIYGKFPKGLIKEITDYYLSKGYKTHVNFTYKQKKPDNSFSIQGKNIIINYFPTTDQFSFNDWTIAHEIGHLVHNYLQDKHGKDTLLNEWIVFNEGHKYNDGYFNNKNYENNFVRISSTKSLNEDIATIFEYLIVYPEDIKYRIIQNPNSNLEKKINYLNNLLLKYTTSIKNTDNIWNGLSVEKSPLNIKGTVEEAHAYGLIPTTDDFNNLLKSNITKQKFLEYIVYIIEKDKNIKLKDYVKSIGKKYDFYDYGTISPVDTMEGKTSVDFDWTKEHKVKISYFWGNQKIDKTDFVYSNAPAFANLLFSLDIVERNKFGDFCGEKVLTREEVAKYIYKMAIASGKNPIILNKTYSDKNIIDNKYKEAVNFVVDNNIISLKENNCFEPKTSFTYEEAYLAMLNYTKTYAQHLFIPIDKDFKYLTDPIYDGSDFFSDGLARVNKGNQVCFIDTSFNEKFKLPSSLEADLYTHFSHGKTALYKRNFDSEGNYTYKDIVIIDNLGNVINTIDCSKMNETYIKQTSHLISYEPKGDHSQFLYVPNKYVDYNNVKYDYLYMYEAGNVIIAKNKSNKYVLLNFEKKEITPIAYDDLTYKDNIILSRKSRNYGAFNRDGKEIVPCIYSQVVVKGDYVFASDNEIDNNGLIVDKNGKIVAKGLYSQNIEEGYNVIANKNYTEYKVVDNYLNTLFKHNRQINYIGCGYFYELKNYSFNILNNKGKVVRSGLTQVPEFSDGYAILRNRNKWEIVDNSFKTVATIDTSKYKIDHYLTFIKNVARIYSGSKVGGINTNGIIIPPIYDSILCSNNLSVVKLNNKFGCIDKNGNVLFKPEYDEIKVNDALIVVKKDNQYAVYDFKGKQLLDFVDYNSITPFSTIPYVKIQKEKSKKEVYMDQYGKVFDKVKPIYGLNKKFILISKKITETDVFGQTKEKLLYGLLDENNNKILDTKYTLIIVRTDSNLISVNNQDYLEGYVDYEGKEIVPIKYNSVNYLSSKVFYVSNGYKVGVLGERGNIIIPFIYDNIFVNDTKDTIIYTINNKTGYLEYPKK